MVSVDLLCLRLSSWVLCSSVIFSYVRVKKLIGSAEWGDALSAEASGFWENYSASVFKFEVNGYSKCHPSSEYTDLISCILYDKKEVSYVVSLVSFFFLFTLLKYIDLLPLKWIFKMKQKQKLVFNWLTLAAKDWRFKNCYGL